ncbi:MAG: serine acetyltransferase [Candidatus Kapabacteria bacterium]|jgi:serine O-acetyltransferase|nr:serine acetyltransferase [Candidatus Kapabacteria bacterium]
MPQSSVLPDFSAIVPTIVQKALEYQNTLPTRNDARLFAEGILQALFPHFVSAQRECCEEDTSAQLQAMYHQLIQILTPYQKQIENSVIDIATRFFARLPVIYERLWLDAEAIFQGDPAAESIEEVILAYPGFHATAVYRIAHEFYVQNVPLFPRLLSEYAHSATGIDIHPGARIGERFCIDHGTGVVIGETTEIGNNVKIYQGVTLGALSVKKSLAETKRHPTIEDNVVIYSNATILGGQTVIGANSVIGGNVWLTQSISPFSLVFNTNKIRVQTAPNSYTTNATEDWDYVI